MNTKKDASMTYDVIKFRTECQSKVACVALNTSRVVLWLYSFHAYDMLNMYVAIKVSMLLPNHTTL